MPVTPFHLGPGLFFGIIFIRYIDLLAFLIGNVILDIEPFLVVVYEQFFKFSPYPYHGFFHTIVGAFLMSLLAAIILKEIQQKIRKASRSSKYLELNLLRLDFGPVLKGDAGFSKIFFSVFGGALLHLIFDSFTHHDVWPFWPSHFNALLGLTNFSQNHINCIILGILGMVLLILKIKRDKS